MYYFALMSFVLLCAIIASTSKHTKTKTKRSVNLVFRRRGKHFMRNINEKKTYTKITHFVLKRIMLSLDIYF